VHCWWALTGGVGEARGGVVLKDRLSALHSRREIPAPSRANEPSSPADDEARRSGAYSRRHSTVKPPYRAIYTVTEALIVAPFEMLPSQAGLQRRVTTRELTREM
jgi:hypothetical protein